MSARDCARCGHPAEAGLRFCVNCGAPLASPPPHVGPDPAAPPPAATGCRACAAPLTPGLRFCTTCGADQRAAADAVKPSGSAATSDPPPPVEPPAPSEPTKQADETWVGPVVDAGPHDTVIRRIEGYPFSSEPDPPTGAATTPRAADPTPAFELPSFEPPAPLDVSPPAPSQAPDPAPWSRQAPAPPPVTPSVFPEDATGVRPTTSWPPATAPQPDYPVPAATQPAEPPRRRGRRVVSVVAAVVLLAAAGAGGAAGYSMLTGDDPDTDTTQTVGEASSDEQTTGEPSPAAASTDADETPVETPTAEPPPEPDPPTFQCWNGTPSNGPKQCPPLRGPQAMSWLFSSFRPEQCEPVRHVSRERWACYSTISDGTQIRYNYSSWNSVAAAYRHYDNLPGAVRQDFYTPAGEVGRHRWMLFNGHDYKAAVVYASVPWSVSLYAPSSAARAQALAELGMRPASHVHGVRR
ncbi:double zinc ribbon domain-containing protein [Nocardioides ferulae]|uniref:double zinc ribbon domain-containing protein n=1 Tax=Nocardioides ferulae TaxID=2340821 RepID=UPI0013DE2DC9|nr:zinc ribbon domain-containing protein [Nocardioides ferulae]